ncbi:MAG: sulfite exporter TauE/SafE family protein [Solirubrobacteraceae bacterium]|nr:sulfite exporter TauE/SafE family protein [Solirubrobacteraceae bacterium]
MSILEALALLVAGFGAGTINAIVGSGTLITFPTLLFLGYPPLVANVSNNIGLVAGGIGSIRGYRDELAGHGPTIRRLLPASIVGSATGALLLLVLPEDAFVAIVPVLIALALVLVVSGPSLNRRFAAAHARRAVDARDAALAADPTAEPTDAATVDPASAPTTAAARAEGIAPGIVGTITLAGVLLAGVYGGYFGAAQGVLLIGVMSVLMADPLQRINGFKNVLGTAVNAVAAIIFVIVATDKIDWAVVGVIAVGALGGGYAGARIGRQLPPTALRGLIVVIGTIAILKIVFFD